MKKFICRLLIFFSLAYCVDYVFGKSVARLQNSSRGGTTQRDNYIMDKCNEDVLIMGSSRASHHYISKMIEDSLHISTYNAGRDGNGIILNYGFLVEVLKRYRPSAIIYELTPSFDLMIGDNERYLPHLRCRYDSDEEIRTLFNDVSPVEKYKMFSQTYRINSLIPHLLYDNFLSASDVNQGYIPLYGLMEKGNRSDGNTMVQDTPRQRMELDSVKEKYLRKFIALCSDRGIKLYFAMSPKPNSGSEESSIALEELKVSEQNGIDILYWFKSDERFTDISLFQDASHLNDKGAREYTKIIIENLKNKSVVNQIE